MQNFGHTYAKGAKVKSTNRSRIVPLGISASPAHSVINHFNPKRIFLSFLILIPIILSSFIQVEVPPTDKFVVVIDPGHGGRDPGTIGKISVEKDIALSISLKVGKYIEDNLKDVKVIYTRTTDVYPELHERPELANKNKADLFMSIHVDGVENAKVFGTGSYVMGLHKNEENLAVAQRENAVIMKEENYKSKYAGFDPYSPESYIRISLEQNAYMELSLLLAAKIQDQFANRAGRKSRGVHQMGFLVLWQTTMPSVLIETGFLTNPEEEKFLNSEYGQDLIASGIYRAFRDYKNEISAKTVSTFELQKLDSINSIMNDPLVEKSDSGIVFKVQVASSSKQIPLVPKNFAGLENVEETLIGGTYKYTVGNFSDYHQISSFFKEVKKKVPDAFLVAFKNGEKISVKKARKELKD
ncbi:MAG: N-acetylmuramoyl-L-alanine amidase [Bacteroidales bacterium]|nr:N-acetylmuramoyl-L-alanine amidase [Bacteroidales bacterium]